MTRLVFGCGFLGLRAAKLWQAAGDQVFVITRNQGRTSNLSDLGLTPIVADITKPETLGHLPSADTVLFAVGMDRSTYSDIRMVYVDGLKNVLNVLPDTSGQFIYISSTGVYGDFGGDWVNERSTTNPAREGGKACLEAEAILSESKFGPRATILRFAGIYGRGRVPTKTLIESGQWKKLSANGYLNLIHADDGARIICQIAAHEPQAKVFGETFLVSDGNPPLRKTYYEHIARHFGFDEVPWELSAVPPENDRSSSSKRIGNKKLLDTIDFQFTYPSYEQGLNEALE